MTNRLKVAILFLPAGMDPAGFLEGISPMATAPITADQAAEAASVEANEAGYEAAMTGVRYSANPYNRLTDSDRHDAWGAGWEQGESVKAEAGA